MTLIRRWGLMFAVAGLLTASSLVTATSVEAAPEVRTYSISGAFTLGPLPLTLPAGSTFTATVESTTGAFTDGVASIPTFPAAGAPNPTNVTITSAAPATGTIAPGTGVTTVNASLNIVLNTITPASTCTIGPVNLTLATTNPGGAPIVGDPPTGILTAAGFTVPAIPTPATPPCDNGEAMGINGFVMLPQTTTQATITSTLIPAAPSAPAAPAPVVAARPSFTG